MGVSRVRQNAHKGFRSSRRSIAAPTRSLRTGILPGTAHAPPCRGFLGVPQVEVRVRVLDGNG